MEFEDRDFEDMIACADNDQDGLISEEEFYQFVNFSRAY
jgi:Ca2+-binding EF-hand superfamily protein